MNRLGAETSPYLQQHRDNPVDWYPWGDEAFERAKADDKPILLSVGYSACHWCHVMAHESFEDEATAAVMNELFVNVKVDREERPDVDAIYMEATQALTGHGGWPMTVFCTPDGKPFYCGTYFPKEPRGSLPSFVQLCQAIGDAWNEQRDDVVAQGDELTSHLETTAHQLLGSDLLPSPDVLMTAAAQLRQQHDPDWGGFGGAPKFPQTMGLEVLLRVHASGDDDRALPIVETSLDAMAAGGMYDHLGGGFARYSVDARWLVPHFEKMLYDQALLARVYLHGWQVTGADRFRQVLEETIEYVRRDLTHPEGGFYSAEDADSEGEEGKFYVWQPDEIRSALDGDADLAAEVTAWYGVTDDGNFEGANILNRMAHRGELARPPHIEAARQRLFESRSKRVRPGLDDKVLTEWNGLMVATLAEAGAATGNADWTAAAVRAGDFLLRALRRDDGRWLRAWKDGQAKTLAFAADYGALVDAFTRLAEATGEARWIAAGRATADGLLDLFWDEERGGVFTTGTDAEQLITRPKDLLDNATPGANSLAAVGLLRLSALTGDDRYHDHAMRIVHLLTETGANHPRALGHLLGAVDLASTGITEIVVTGTRPDLVGAVHARYLPNAVLAWGERYESPLWEGRAEVGPAGRAYVCRNYTCDAPITDPETLASRLAIR